MIVLPYLAHTPRLGDAISAAADAVIIGRATVGPRCHFGQLATVRADGEDIRIGADCWFADFSTVHIAHSVFPAVVAAGCSVARYALVHACDLASGVVLGENAVVMDNTQVGAGAVIAADSMVPPGKTLAGGWLYAGKPAKPVREVGAAELTALHARVRGGTLAHAAIDAIVLSATPVAALRQLPGSGIAGIRADGAYVAPTASLTGVMQLAAQASIWFGVEIIGRGATLDIGTGSNVQDNTRIVLNPGERVRLGRRVTVGHNVRMAACDIGDEALVGMGSQVGAGTVVGAGGVIAAGAVTAPGTVVAAGEIWAGVPAQRWKALSPENRAMFARGAAAYIEYAGNYAR